MTIIDALGWWYGWGWMHVFDVSRRRLVRLYHVFSVRQMLRTLFAPWKEDRIYGARGLDNMLRAAVMNGVSRLIGFLVRVAFLVAYVMASLALLVLTGIVMVVWPLTPLLIPALIIGGLWL